jgi:hypothetical protein
MIRSTSPFANLQRSLRPYLEAVPPSLHGLIHLLQGYTCSPSVEPVSINNPQPLVRVHQRLIAVAQQCIQTGQGKAAETLLLEVIQSADASGKPAIAVQALLDIGKAMIESDRCANAVQILQSAVQHCRTICDPIAMKEAQKLLATARLGGKSPRSNAVSPPPVPGPQTQPMRYAPAAQPIPVASVMPTVSIIIPTFSKIELTRQCLRALLANTPALLHEIIVVDNGSTDGTPDFLRAEE